MSESNKSVLEAANAEIVKGNNEGFLAHCAEDIRWTTVGEGTLEGKQAVREWMKDAYAQPPHFTVERLVAEGDMVVALGTIQALDDDGGAVHSAYSDVWRFRDGLMVELRAFVVRPSKKTA